MKTHFLSRRENLLLLALDSAVVGPELGGICAPFAAALEELGVGEVMAARLRSPHGVRVTH